MPTNTTNYGLLKPLVNNATDQDLWGGYLNDDMDDIDSLTKTAINWTASSKTNSFSITAPTSGSIATGGSKTVYLCDATGGAITASLPAASTCSGMTITVKKTDASANAVTVDGDGSETIDGATTHVLSARYQFVVIVSNGTNWDILSQTGYVNGSALANGTTATTQSPGDNSTKVATTAYADAAASAVDRVKAWGYVQSNGTVSGGYNVASVNANGSGSYTVLFTNAMADANYAVTATIAQTNTISGSNGTYVYLRPDIKKDTAGFNIQFVLSGSAANPSAFSFEVNR